MTGTDGYIILLQAGRIQQSAYFYWQPYLNILHCRMTYIIVIMTVEPHLTSLVVMAKAMIMLSP